MAYFFSTPVDIDIVFVSEPGDRTMRLELLPLRRNRFTLYSCAATNFAWLAVGRCR